MGRASPLCAGLCVARRSPFDHGSGEAKGPRWPRQLQASRVSEPSIPRWSLHSCENRKAAPSTNTGGAGGEMANLWLINNNPPRSPSLSLSLSHLFLDWSCVSFQCYFIFGVLLWKQMLPAQQRQLYFCFCCVCVYFPVRCGTLDGLDSPLCWTADCC